MGELTKTGMMLGSPKYMSPEQLNGVTIDARADVWSIGAMLYTMLTGRPPYDFPQVTQTFMAIASGVRPATPSSIEPAIPPALDALILRCLAHDRAHRVQDVAELAGAALEAVDSPFAQQVRDVIGAVLEPGSAPSSRPRLSLSSPATGSHAAFTLGSASTVPDAAAAGDPALLVSSGGGSRQKAWWAVGVAVAVARHRSSWRGRRRRRRGTAATARMRTRGFTAKTLAGERTTSLASGAALAVDHARVWTRGSARTLVASSPARDDPPAPTPALVTLVPRATAKPAPTSSHRAR